MQNDQNTMPNSTFPSSYPITIGISPCLLGEHVRYDGGHRYDRYISETLSKIFRFVSVCPEVGCGLPIPREPMRLEGEPASPRLVTITSRQDRTEQMLEYCNAKVTELETEDLCGFILKKNSPSCGLYGVKVYNESMPVKNGTGLFAAALVRHFPMLPVEEEERLNNVAIRENYLQRILSYRRWKDLEKSKQRMFK